MATVTSTLKLNDQMTKVLTGINRAMGSTLRAMEQTDIASSKAFRSAKKDVPMATRQVDEFAEAFNGVPSPVNNAKGSVEGLLRKVIGLAAVAYGVKKAFDSWNKITDISDKVSLARGGLEMLDFSSSYDSLADFETAIMESANRSRAYFLDTAEAVGQIGINAKKAFTDANGALNTKELVAFSELVNKSFKVSRASTAEQSGAMRQLTQALSSGVLRGDEFNSIAENAPIIKQAVEDYVNAMEMNPDGLDIRELAADGLLTADIVKQAMFMAADDIESKFSTLPKTWADNWTLMKNDALVAFAPVLDKVSEMANSEQFQVFMQDISSFLSIAAEYALEFLDMLANIASSIHSNWHTIKPLLIGLITTIGIITVVTGIWSAAQWILNFALTANPIALIIIAIAALIGAIIIIALRIMDLWKTNLDFKYGILSIWDSIIHFFKGIPLFFAKVGNGIADAFSYAKVMVLTILQSMANGAIDIINNLIEMLNKIPGVAIDPIEHLTFATTMAAKEEAKRQARSADVATQQAALDAEKAAQQATRDAQRAVDQASIDSKALAAEAAKNEANSQAANGMDYSEFGGAGTAGGNGDIGRVGSVGRIEDDITISEEDIKLLKDIASMEYQVNYTQLTPQASFGDTYISKEVDAEEVMDKLTGFVSESMQSQLVIG